MKKPFLTSVLMFIFLNAANNGSAQAPDRIGWYNKAKQFCARARSYDDLDDCAYRMESFRDEFRGSRVSDEAENIRRHAVVLKNGTSSGRPYRPAYQPPTCPGGLRFNGSFCVQW